MDASDNKDVKLSAEVEPFIPQKKGLEGSLVSMSLSGEAGGGGGGGGIGGGGGGVETTPIPSYLITCYPFVQENQPNRQHPMYNGGELRWQQPNPSPGGSYLAYPILSTPQPPVSNDYAYYQIMPAPCPPVMGFYQPFPGTYAGPVQAGVVNPVSADVSERPLPLGPAYGMASQRGRGMVRPNVLPKQQLGVCQPPRGRRPPTRSVAVQKEVCTLGPDGRTKTVTLVDAAQQTDFPGEVSGRCAAERASPLLWKNRTKRRRASHPAEGYNEQGASEADIDSDSGYCSPKHNQAAGVAQRTAENTAAPTGVEAGVMTGTWVNVASQATQKSWGDRNSQFHRADQRKNPEQRNFSQRLHVYTGVVAGTKNAMRQHIRSILATEDSGTNRMNSQDFHSGYPGRVPPNQLEQRLQPAVVTSTELTPEPLYFEDEDEFPDLTTGGAVQRSTKPESTSAQTHAQPKLPKNLLDNLPENSPINIVQTPIPITTSVPKRAKSQRKKALAAALATAQEYSEISMEQKKLQEAFTKAAGKKSKTSVELDLGDMLAALEKHQQAMKARQLTNTKPLSFTVGTTTPFHGSGLTSMPSMLKGHQQPFSAPHNALDSTAPRIKRGKEREIPKVKRPTALKKIILKEREGKKGKTSVEQESSGQEEHGDESLHFTDDLAREPASQESEDNGLSMPSDASLSPASQNSPYSITPVSQGSPASSGIGSPMASNAITKIHSRRFREYCNQVLSKEIDESVTMLLQELVRFQERVYQKDPTKAKSKRRLVMGLREVTKHMKLHKIKCVIISPNCEKIQAKGGLDEALYNVIAMARDQEIPFVFALGRKALGRCVNKLVPVSVVGIFNYSGAEGLFNRLVSLTEEARKAYKDMVSALEQEQAEEALKNDKKVPHHMGHSRNHSAASAISFCSIFSEPISEVNEKEYETNWRSMVETSDALEPVEAEPSRPAPATATQKDGETLAATTNTALSGSTAPQPRAVPQTLTQGTSERDEVRVDDRLELASQQSTETGSLDGSCRGPLNSSITSTTSTLVPGMLEEAEEEEEEEEDYTPEPISVEVPTLSSRIESWVSKTLENLQLGKSQESTEEEEDEEEEDDEEERGQSEEEEDLDSADITETRTEGNEQEEAKKVTG
ncbi:selenocysteine insertion sequence-binding protein 2-like isoform X2 [Sander lucioperca]|uniref:selenocysteine insertion sequence-binding protein 2-like isoform X2 n=1 Tax=Sander lucioperca TaxID=283035 RepID=UPI00125DF574|nr:selenocysteine insertion sequence-binding protein 2-like isoform X2 [Sander lucioperca]